MGSAPESSSPWPAVVALGIVTAEVGVLFGFVTIAVGGVLLFGGACAGLVHEAGYAETVWRPLGAVGVVLGTAAALVWTLRAAAFTPDAFRAAAFGDPFAYRATIVLGAAALLVVAGGVGPAVATRR